jgi:outer membrane protein TolC
MKALTERPAGVRRKLERSPLIRGWLVWLTLGGLVFGPLGCHSGNRRTAEPANLGEMVREGDGETATTPTTPNEEPHQKRESEHQCQVQVSWGTNDSGNPDGVGDPWYSVSASGEPLSSRSEKPSDQASDDKWTPDPTGKRKPGGTTSKDPRAKASQGPLAADTPIIPTSIQECVINLPAALRIAGLDNPTIALSAEAVQEALGLEERALALLLPSLTAGGNYHLHRGNLQGSSGIIRDVNSESLYFGAGARTLAAESVAYPGIRLFAHLADALYAPEAAVHDVANRRFTATATRNDVLLDVAVRYLALLGAEGRLAVIRQSEDDFNEILRLTTDYAETGKGQKSDAERARTDTLLLHSLEQQTQEEVAVAAADLARLLHIDPSLRLRINDEPIQVIQLVDSAPSLEQLVQVAVRARPEVAAWTAAMAAADARYRQELARPLLPLLSVGYSAGDFGGGSNQTSPEFGRFSGRTDFDAYAVWTWQNMGLGNLAIQKARRAQINEAMAQRAQAVTDVRREVADAYNLSATRRREVEVARRRVETALKGFQLDLVRIRGNEGRPIEVLNSARGLVSGRQELLFAIIGYDRAQFQLFVALGQPPCCALPTAPGSEPAREQVRFQGAEAVSAVTSADLSSPKREDKVKP